MREDQMDSVQLTPVMINRARAIQAVHLVKPNTVRRFRLADGAMRQFLQTSRAVQNLPSFAAKGRRE